jgi:uncharacterized small protein (DUF1192 family)
VRSEAQLERNGRLRRPTFKRDGARLPLRSEVERSEAELERNGRLRRPTFKRDGARLPLRSEVERSEAELERETGFEPATSTLARSRSTK